MLRDYQIKAIEDIEKSLIEVKKVYASNAYRSREDIRFL